MKKTVLLLLATLTMACIVTGCEEEGGFPEEEAWGYYINLSGDKLVDIWDSSSFIKYSPRDLKDYPDFLHVEEIDASDKMTAWFSRYMWTGILDGKRYYADHTSLGSQLFGNIYTESGEYYQFQNEDNWTDIEVIYIHPAYIEHCNKKKIPLYIIVPACN